MCGPSEPTATANEDRQDDGDTSTGALYSAESYIAASAAASGAAHGSSEAFSASFKALLEWGELNGFIRDSSQFEFFKRPPDGHGDEHEAWFDEQSNSWFKAAHSTIRQISCADSVRFFLNVWDGYGVLMGSCDNYVVTEDCGASRIKSAES